MTVYEALKEAADALERSGVPDSRLDAELLLAYVLGVSRMELILKAHEDLSNAAHSSYNALLARRNQREPLQYILSSQSFMGFDMYVDKNVLIPRPETELLCELALKWLKEQNHASLRILDLCTGSGALAIAIACLMPGAQVFAADISENALAVAKKNANIHHATVAFSQGDFLSAVFGLQFDLIVCNPPYIPTAVCEGLQAEVRKEPQIALDGGMDGLHFYRLLANEAPLSLCPGGALFCEVGYDQAEAVRSLLAPSFEQTEIIDDLNHIPRIVTAQSLKSLPGGFHVRQV